MIPQSAKVTLSCLLVAAPLLASPASAHVNPYLRRHHHHEHHHHHHHHPRPRIVVVPERRSLPEVILDRSYLQCDYRGRCRWGVFKDLTPRNVLREVENGLNRRQETAAPITGDESIDSFLRRLRTRHTIYGRTYGAELIRW